MLKYVISIIILLAFWNSNAQETARVEKVAIDSTQFERSYGLRVGIDAASLLRTVLDDEYTGFQILGDYRITRDLYIAGELGNEQLQRTSDRVDFETSGSFFKAGIDYNVYDNWLDMDNLVYFGARIGAASMSQTLQRFEFNTVNDFFPVDEQLVNREFNGLNALWLELQLGIKVEVLPNFYLTANVQLKRMLTESTPDNFDNLYVPGFGRTYDTGEIGVGYVYGITYRIPFYRN